MITLGKYFTVLAQIRPRCNLKVLASEYSVKIRIFGSIVHLSTKDNYTLVFLGTSLLNDQILKTNDVIITYACVAERNALN